MNQLWLTLDENIGQLTLDPDAEVDPRVLARREHELEQWRRKYYMRAARPLMLHKLDAGLDVDYLGLEKRRPLTIQGCKHCGLLIHKQSWYIHHPNNDLAGSLKWQRTNVIVKELRAEYCQKHEPKNDRALIKRAYRWLKEETPCSDCGRYFPADVMDLDHLPQYEKKHAMNVLAKDGSLTEFIDELSKCELVCANCHRLRTRRRWDAEGTG